MLRVRGKRPSERRTTHKGCELPPPHSTPPCSSGDAARLAALSAHASVYWIARAHERRQLGSVHSGRRSMPRYPHSANASRLAAAVMVLQFSRGTVASSHPTDDGDIAEVQGNSERKGGAVGAQLIVEIASEPAAKRHPNDVAEEPDWHSPCSFVVGDCAT